jgi:hypothetical protein
VTAISSAREGVEHILEPTTTRIRIIVVETRGEFDSNKRTVAEILLDRKYEIATESSVNVEREIDIVTATDAS